MATAAARARQPGVGWSPERFGDYLVLGKVASGGMAEVYLATALSGELAGLPVALKRMLPRLSEQPRYVEMFLSEAVICSRIRHDNVARIFDYGEVDGRYFIAMEYLHGASLGALLTRLSKRGRRLKLRFAGAVFDGVCAGLQAAHDLGIVHRDISPNNIFITTGGAVKLLDFGVAKASFVSTNTRAGVVKGTFAYMSPEHLEGSALDARTDVFSLGVVMHEALTCRRLFKRDTDYETCRAITREPIPRVGELRSSVPAALSDTIGRALARRRQDRFASADELRAALAAALHESDRRFDPAAMGAEIGRIFATELERIDDLVAEQPTRVALSRSARRAPMGAPRGRHDAGDIIAALPLRPKSANDAELLDEVHPTGSVAAVDDSESGELVCPAPTTAVSAAERAAPRRSRRSARLVALAATVFAAGLLVADGGAAGLRSEAAQPPRDAVQVAPAAPATARPAAERAPLVAPLVEPGDGSESVDAPVAEQVAPEAPEPKRTRKRSTRQRSTRAAASREGPGARIAAEL